MARRRTLSGLLLAILTTFQVASVPALANEFAEGGRLAGSQIYDGFRGNQGIRTDPATVSGVAFVHHTQADVGPAGGDFVAVGTYNGLGATVPGTNQSVTQYFWDQPIDSEVTSTSLLAAEGIEFARNAMPNVESFATYMLAEEPGRAVSVEIGPYPAALIWADPRANGVRTHNLYWADGIYDYGLVADRTAAELVNIGRGIACGS